MTTSPGPAASPPETTDLERRVLAHERILQSLIAYMARTEPRFVDHLRKRFVEPMTMARREHDHRDVDDYAEEFIRAVMLLGNARTSRAPTGSSVVSSTREMDREKAPRQPFPSALRADRVQVRERSGVFEVRVDGAFRGDYHRKENALAAAALARITL